MLLLLLLVVVLVLCLVLFPFYFLILKDVLRPVKQQKAPRRETDAQRRQNTPPRVPGRRMPAHSSSALMAAGRQHPSAILLVAIKGALGYGGIIQPAIILCPHPHDIGQRVHHPSRLHLEVHAIAHEPLENPWLELLEDGLEHVEFHD